jgi:hypothetical protein
MGRKSTVAPAIAALVLAGLSFGSLVVLVAGPGVPSVPRELPTPGLAPLGVAPNLTIGDDSSANVTVGGNVTVTVNDSVSDGTATSDGRTYWIVVRSTPVDPNVTVRLTTFPLNDWSFPDQLPGGADNLPPLPLWNWTVWRDGQNDTANWTEELAWGSQLDRFMPALDAAYEVVGTTQPVLPVTVGGSAPDEPTATRPGVTVQQSSGGTLYSANDSNYSNLLRGIDPNVLRIGMSSIGTDASWQNATGSVWLNFSNFDAAVALGTQVGAQMYLSLPAGTWGDGNLLPRGMPVDPTLAVPFGTTVGYFPTGPAYVAYLDTILAHTVATGETITYWNFGNEMPLVNLTIVDRYITLFNLVASTIHAVYPDALVGSDVMTNRTYEATFAASAIGVGFLSFHYYPAAGLCLQNGSYCAPTTGAGSSEPVLFRPVSSISDVSFLPPFEAQSMWFNATGHWIPILDSETNLNGAGGNPPASAFGTDPRQQSLFAAAWLVSTLLNTTEQNVSDLVYYTFTSSPPPPTSITEPYGGWGFGMTAEGPNQTEIRYAPYWAMALWAAASPAGSHPIRVTTDPTGVIGAYASRIGSSIRVVLVNRADVPVRVPLGFVAMNASVRSQEVLDSRSYQEVYSASNNSTQLLRSGVTIQNGTNSTVLIDGYGVALVTASVGGNSNSSGSGGGNGTGGQNGTGGTGNSSGGGGNGTSGGGNGTGAGGSSGSGSGVNRSGSSSGATGTVPGVGVPPTNAHPARSTGAAPNVTLAGQGRVGPGDPSIGDVLGPQLVVAAALGAFGLVGSAAVWKYTPEPPRTDRPSGLPARGRAAGRPRVATRTH